MLTYLRQATDELRHVTWPTRRQAVRLAAIVIVFTIASALLYGVIDLLLGQGVFLLLSIR